LDLVTVATKILGLLVALVQAGILVVVHGHRLLEEEEENQVNLLLGEGFSPMIGGEFIMVPLPVFEPSVLVIKVDLHQVVTPMLHRVLAVL
jgi:hypothetical protein